MTRKECKKRADELRGEACTINDSINWTAGKAHSVFDKIEKIGDCQAPECEEEIVVLFSEAEKYLCKLDYENKVLDKYQADLEEVMDLCSSGNIDS